MEKLLCGEMKTQQPLRFIHICNLDASETETNRIKYLRQGNEEYLSAIVKFSDKKLYILGFKHSHVNRFHARRLHLSPNCIILTRTRTIVAHSYMLE
jgi:hypothetical protein